MCASHGTVQKQRMFPSQSESGAGETQGRTFRLTVAYDGTDFFGWQVQPGLPTVQGTLAGCIQQITGEAVLPQGSGRTDTGVHAVGQVVSLVLHAAIPSKSLQRALNQRLPPSIRVLSLSEVADGFHARSGVTNKTYEYRIFERRSPADAGAKARVCLPQIARYVWDCRWALQVGPMQQAAAALVGTHDFTSFAATDPDRSERMATSPEAANNIRTVFSSDWLLRDDLLVYRITGSGFLHHMVRNIVGTCIEAGAGRLDPGSVPAILAARDRQRAGATVPPQGLHLIQVVYKADHALGGPA
jgi:tRNA pseudouridine38-40 synthase